MHHRLPPTHSLAAWRTPQRTHQRAQAFIGRLALSTTVLTACGLSALAVLSLAPMSAWAQDASASSEQGTATPASTARSQREADAEAALRAVKASQIPGPTDIVLRDQATLKLPAGYLWVPEPAASQLMRAMGNHPDERLLGLVFPQSDEQGWMAVARYEPSGHIPEDDAEHWDVDGLYNGLKEGTESGNEERRQKGFPELDIGGWVEKPAYDAASHRLVWSLSVRHKGAAANAPTSINYNTYALGREGYVTLNLITDLKDIAQDKRHAQALLSALSFSEGKRYADFNASTDKVAEYGLAALVGGLAAKKIGLFALAAGFMAKFAKVIAVVAFGGWAVFKRFFKRGKAQDPQA
jgi:uncharacterized membrane-anchored protein